MAESAAVRMIFIKEVLSRKIDKRCGTDNGGATSFYLYGTPEGKMVLNGTGYTSRFVGISGCWITA